MGWAEARGFYFWFPDHIISLLRSTLIVASAEPVKRFVPVAPNCSHRLPSDIGMLSLLFLLALIRPKRVKCDVTRHGCRGYGEMVNTTVLETVGRWPCRFKSYYPHYDTK